MKNTMGRWSKVFALSGMMAAAGLIGFGLADRASAQAPAGKAPTAGETFKNVKTAALSALTVDDFMASMGVISADLGLDCADCHPGAGTDHVDWVFDTPQKKTARRMIDMVGAINKTNFGGVQMVTCWTCHHGREQPGQSIALDKLYGSPNDEKDDLVQQGQGEPTGQQVIDKYITALGGAQKLAGLKSWIATGTSLGYEGLGGGGTFQIYAKAPDQRATMITFKDHPERGDNIRTFNGKTGWFKQPRAAVPEYELRGSELDGMHTDALTSFPGQLKTVLTDFKVNTADLGEHDAQVVQARGPNRYLVTMYFDKKTGLLIRTVRFSQSPVGRVPTQMDYADYRDVNGIKFPFKYTYSWLDGRDSFQIKEYKLNTPIDESIFGKPK